MTERTIIGCLIEATAPRRPKRRGVVLPPARRSRNGALRITVDGKAPIPFKPDEWTIRIIAGPVYGYDDLPAEHLATYTMLQREMRLRPANELTGWIAEYKVRKGTVVLYPVADAIPMLELSPARAEAWTKARTCIHCSKVAPRPFEASPAGDRYCLACHQVVALERWTDQARAAQAEAAEWAREVLADPRTVFLAAETHPRGAAGVWWHLRAVTAAGDVIADARIRYSDETEDVARHPDFWTPERIAEHQARREGTIGRDEFRPTLEDIAGRRIIMWRSSWGRAPFPSDVESVIPAGDQVCERLALWSGWTWGRYGYWMPEPKIPWGQTTTHPAYKGFEALLREPRELAAETAGLIGLIRGMVDGQAPEPAVGHPTVSVPRS